MGYALGMWFLQYRFGIGFGGYRFGIGFLGCRFGMGFGGYRFAIDFLGYRFEIGFWDVVLGLDSIIFVDLVVHKWTFQQKYVDRTIRIWSFFQDL